MRGYPANYVTDFMKAHKKKMLAWAQELRVHNPTSIAWKKWSEEREKEVEEYQARKAEEDVRKVVEQTERAEMQGLNDTIASLCASSHSVLESQTFCFTLMNIVLILEFCTYKDWMHRELASRCGSC